MVEMYIQKEICLTDIGNTGGVALPQGNKSTGRGQDWQMSGPFDAPREGNSICYVSLAAIASEFFLVW